MEKEIFCKINELLWSEWNRLYTRAMSAGKFTFKLLYYNQWYEYKKNSYNTDCDETDTLCILRYVWGGGKRHIPEICVNNYSRPAAYMWPPIDHNTAGDDDTSCYEYKRGTERPYAPQTVITLPPLRVGNNCKSTFFIMLNYHRLA